ncbi:DMT family transporter [Nocardia australiensis]|uniref:DMT family transporter n=1 Tax=Nocardia australiensis TaxID=2887191 RepID=UPI001D143B31|nr:DMT family transporter [Nocardia australiensis]
MIAVTCMWGTSSALLAALAAPTTAGLVALGGAVPLLVSARLRGQHPWATLTAHPALYVKLGVLEAANLALYVAALRVGPLPVVVALHLTAPVLIIAVALLRGRRAATFAVLLELLLVAAAIWLVTGHHTGGTAAGSAVAGCGLALGSAACVAMLVSVIARQSGPHHATTSAALQLLLGGVASSPLLAFDPPSAPVAAELAAVGATLLGPGFALYWQALRWLDAATASVVGLNEAVVATLVGAVCTQSLPTSATAAGGVLILIAVGLEQRSAPRNRVPP